MEVFEGTVRLAGDTGTLNARLLVADNRLKVSAQDHQIGDWKLSEIMATLSTDGCHVTVDGEELIVSVAEPFRFAEAIGPRLTNPGDGSLRGLGRRTTETERSPGIRRQLSALAGTLSRLAWMTIGTSVLVLSLAIWAPIALVGLVLLASLGCLLVGALALMDPFTAVRLPDPATPNVLLRAGIGGLIVALGLAILL